MNTITVIVPTCNRASSLARTLRSLISTHTSPDFEVIVVDNASQDQTVQVVSKVKQQAPGHRILYEYEPIPGLLSGRHRGAQIAQGEILVFIDDDIEVSTDWLAAIEESFQDPAVQIVGGRNMPAYEAPPPEWLDAFWTGTPYGGRCCGFLSLLDLGESSQIIDANYVWGLNLAIRRAALFELGGFHPDCIPSHLQRYQGDGESGLTRKANELAYSAIYQPKAKVLHHIPASRLTPEYFEKRAYYQGVCDSYAEIRRNRGIQTHVANESLPSVKSASITGFLRKTFLYGRQMVSRALADRRINAPPAKGDGEVAAVQRRVETGYSSGYRFHRDEVRNDSELLTWVLKDDYWDYRLPVTAGVECDGSETLTHFRAAINTPISED